MRSFGPTVSRFAREVRFVRNLEEFQRIPILTELHGEDGAVYVEKWCARDEQTTRTLRVRSDQISIAKYLAEKISLLDLLIQVSDNVGFLVDRTPDKMDVITLVQVSNLPEEYLPRESAMHDVELRGDWATTPQSFLIGADWDAQMLAQLERDYHVAFAFCWLAHRENAQLLPDRIRAIRYNAGWAYNQAFNGIIGAVPRDERPRVGGVSANSPGVFTIEAPSDVAQRLGETLAKFRQTYDEYRAVHEWSRLDESKVKAVPEYAVRDLARLCDVLDIHMDALLPAENRADQGSVLVAGQLAAAYWRRLKGILKSANGEFLGVVHVEGEDENVHVGSIFDDDVFNDEE